MCHTLVESGDLFSGNAVDQSPIIRGFGGQSAFRSDDLGDLFLSEVLLKPGDRLRISEIEDTSDRIFGIFLWIKIRDRDIPKKWI